MGLFGFRVLWFRAVGLKAQGLGFRAFGFWLVRISAFEVVAVFALLPLRVALTELVLVSSMLHIVPGSLGKEQAKETIGDHISNYQ